MKAKAFQIDYQIEELKKQKDQIIEQEIQDKVKEFAAIMIAEKESIDLHSIERILKMFATDIKHISRQ